MAIELRLREGDANNFCYLARTQNKLLLEWDIEFRRVMGMHWAWLVYKKMLGGQL